MTNKTKPNEYILKHIIFLILFGMAMFLLGVIATPHINKIIYGTANIYK